MKFTKVVKANDVRLDLVDDLHDSIFDAVTDTIVYNVDYKNLPRTDLITAVQLAYNKVFKHLDKIIK